MRKIAAICITLTLVIFVVYMQTANHEFLSYDDNTYITENHHVADGITGRNVVWAFTSTYVANWHPLTWLSHMVDVELYGMNPRGHHLTNVAIHSVSALLLLLLLFRGTGHLWQSSFVAALFALHPLHVESVAWVAERKDVLSTFFWFLTLILYFEYVAKRKSVLYILSLLSFILGLMSKPMLVTLPIVMLLMDFWPLNRYRHGEGDQGQQSQLLDRVLVLIKEKTPFIVCSLLSAAITVIAQATGGTMSDFVAVSVENRIENAVIAYVRYLGRTAWPSDLAVLYPMSLTFPAWQVVCSLLVLLLVSVTALRSWRRYPYFPVGWFWFLITLLPVIGLIQVGVQAMADRYTYIPLVGVFIIAAWGVSDLARGVRHKERVLALLAGAVILSTAVMSWRQIGYWRDSVSLYRRTLNVTTGNYIIHNNLGGVLFENGNLDAAMQHYQEALRINPGYIVARRNLGLALFDNGNMDAAIQEYRTILRSTPANADVHYNLGRALYKKGQLEAAIGEFQNVLRINPNYVAAQTLLETALAQKSR